jgi:hypothetical protein
MSFTTNQSNKENTLYFKVFNQSSYNLVYHYYTYCNQNIKLQERIAGSQHWRVSSQKPHDLTDARSPFIRYPVAHAITGDLYVINN